MIRTGIFAVMYIVAAATCCYSVIWALIDFDRIPDSFKRRERARLQRPILARTGALLLVAGVVVTISFRPLMM